jgi:hypothetical protein
VDGQQFYGSCTTGVSSGWIDQWLDLADVYTLGNLIGNPHVWVALVFSSDGSINKAEGAYVDDIALRKVVRATPTVTATPSHTPTFVPFTPVTWLLLPVIVLERAE